MKWGKKKQSSTAFSRPLFISQVLPASWIAKFKQMSMNSGDKHAKVKRKEKWNSVPTNPSSYATTGGGKFYGGDGDAFWRLSFGDDGVDGMKTKGVLRSVRYSSSNDEDNLEFLPSTRESYRSKGTTVHGQEQATKFSDMVSYARKMRGLPTELEIDILPDRQTYVREKVAEIRTPRLKVERERLSQEKQLELDAYQFKMDRVPRKAEAKCTTYKTKPARTPGIVERDRLLAAGEENDGFFEENCNHDWQKLKERKIEEVKSRNKEQRKSLYISRDWQKKRPKQNSKVRVSSPRTASKAEICKIKALEDMKKAKLKMKKKAKEKATEGFHGLESFAMMKCSYDPEKDFRDSMIEMIKEQSISQPEELEELLACYLTLNSDEYHDLIIRVFRQVWIDLNQTGFNSELQD